MTVRRVLLVALLVVPGLAAVAVFGSFALQDWARLQAAYQHFDRLVRTGGDLRSVFLADAVQNIHRINLFADGTWVLLGAILAGIGLHGLCVLPQARRGEMCSDYRAR